MCQGFDTKITLLIGKIKGGLYQLPSSFGQWLNTYMVSCNKAIFDDFLLHDRLRHPHLDVVNHVSYIMNKDLVNTSVFYLCNSCQLVNLIDCLHLLFIINHWLLLKLFMLICEDLPLWFIVKIRGIFVAF